MTLTATRSAHAGVDLFVLRDGEARATVVPARGAGCIDWRDRDGLPVLEDVAFEDVAAKPTSFGIPLLLPFPNRLRDAASTFRGERFDVPPGRHGVVRDKPWRAIDSGATPERGAWVEPGQKLDLAIRIARERL
jgi:aldose 1-epimerase